MMRWSFLTNHARVLVCIANDPGMRLREVAANVDITERSAFSIVNDLVEAGYVIKEKQGRRNRYRIQGDLPLPETVGRQRTIGEVVGLLIDTRAGSAHPSDPSATSRKQPPTRGRGSSGS